MLRSLVGSEMCIRDSYINDKHNVEIKKHVDKLYIRGSIDEENNKMAIEDIRDSITNYTSSGDEWSELTFVKPDDIGHIIGKGRSNINYINDKHNVEVKEHGDKLYIRGGIDEENNKKAIEDIRDSFTNKSSSGDEWNELTFVKPDDIDHIVGRRRSNLIYFMIKYDIDIEQRADKLYILGDVNTVSYTHLTLPTICSV